MTGKILVGTASWSDPGFVADWYPSSVSAANRLRWYADHFNLVEVNSTFYRLPEARMVERWCHETPDGFVFDVKLHRLLSRHSTKAELLPVKIRPNMVEKNQKVKLTPALEKQVLNIFLKPLSRSKIMKSLERFYYNFRPVSDPGLTVLRNSIPSTNVSGNVRLQWSCVIVIG